MGGGQLQMPVHKLGNWLTRRTRLESSIIQRMSKAEYMIGVIHVSDRLLLYHHHHRLLRQKAAHKIQKTEYTDRE